jgi:hypothetical protein
MSVYQNTHRELDTSTAQVPLYHLSATLNRNLPMDTAHDESPGAQIEKLGLVQLSYLNFSPLGAPNSKRLGPAHAAGVQESDQVYLARVLLVICSWARVSQLPGTLLSARRTRCFFTSRISMVRQICMSQMLDDRR